jgi:hypothetical protein
MDFKGDGVSGVGVTENDQGARLSAEQIRRRKARSVAIAVALGILVALFYAVTLAKLGANVLDRPL